MALMADPDRATLHAELMRGIITNGGLVKSELRAAVNAVDAWIDANAASMNLAIPQPARGVLTAAEKAHLFALVALRRYEKGA